KRQQRRQLQLQLQQQRQQQLQLQLQLQQRPPQQRPQPQLQLVVMVWVQIATDSTMGANCAGVGYQPSGTLSSCESYCLSLSGCNAVDWNTGGSGCTPRQCSSYPPNYASQSGWEVWAITSGTSTTSTTTTTTTTTVAG
ncbi:unnamed protein product, partial [Adineta steineri]